MQILHFSSARNRARKLTKNLARALLPRPLLYALSAYYAKKTARRFKELSIEEAFDFIYKSGAWNAGGGRLSGAGSYGEYAEKYVDFLYGFLKSHEIHSITDIGCGDFNIGSQLAGKVTRYHALDVSQEIIDLDKKKYSHLHNVEFRKSNACVDALPVADLVTVRQVLQHLTNQQISDILENIERTGFKYALITEHILSPAKMLAPNLDLRTHSADTRVALRSGVLINEAPFSKPATIVFEIPLAEGLQRVGGEDERLCVFFWNLTEKAGIQAGSL